MCRYILIIHRFWLGCELYTTYEGKTAKSSELFDSGTWNVIFLRLIILYVEVSSWNKLELDASTLRKREPVVTDRNTYC